VVVEMAVVADYGNLSDGKLNVMGVFDRIWTTAFPTVHPSLVLAFRLRLEFEDRDKGHRVEIELVDEDGGKHGGGVGEIEPVGIQAGERQVVSQILPFTGVVFPRAGEYAFVLRWDGAEKVRVPFTVGPQLKPSAQ